MPTRSLPISLALTACLIQVSAARAQSFNVDVGSNGAFPAPTSAYAGAANQPGAWNARSALVASAGLVDLAGAPTGVTLSVAGGFADYEFDHPSTSADDGALLDDLHDLANGSATWTFQNLAAGSYTLTTYAWAPDSDTFRSSVACGSIDPPQTVGGTWTGAHQLGVTFARHRVDLQAAGSIAVSIGTAVGFGSVNGFQLARAPDAPAVFCAGDGSATTCPCGNAGAAGHGCASSVSASGARLDAQGSASLSADTLVLQGSLMPNSSALYFQGTSRQAAGLGAVFGDGLRCAAGSVIRLGTQTNAGGSSIYPAATDLGIGLKGANGAGGSRAYQCWYRNAASFCTPSTFNLTNGVWLAWAP